MFANLLQVCRFQRGKIVQAGELNRIESLRHGIVDQLHVFPAKCPKRVGVEAETDRRASSGEKRGCGRGLEKGSSIHATTDHTRM